jgi:hypothetical protein
LQDDRAFFFVKKLEVMENLFDACKNSPRSQRSKSSEFTKAVEQYLWTYIQDHFIPTICFLFVHIADSLGVHSVQSDMVLPELLEKFLSNVESSKTAIQVRSHSSELANFLGTISYVRSTCKAQGRSECKASSTKFATMDLWNL